METFKVVLPALTGNVSKKKLHLMDSKIKSSQDLMHSDLVG